MKDIEGKKVIEEQTRETWRNVGIGQIGNNRWRKWQRDIWEEGAWKRKGGKTGKI